MTDAAADNILSFWFKELSPAQWWQKDAALDAMMTKRFATVHSQAAAGELWSWRRTAQGRLAEVIVLDQFSRNMFRGSARAFAYDGMALMLMQDAVACGDDLTLNADERHFLYMPAMHSESKVVHEEALRLYKKLGNAQAVEFELKHKMIIDRFGRYPHRNEALSRKSTPEEQTFLLEPASAF